MTEAIIVVFLTQVAAILIALINRYEIAKNKKSIDVAQENAVTAAQAAVIAAREVSGQFKNNGGSTMKDQLDRIEHRFEETNARMNLLQQADINDRHAAVVAHENIYTAIEDIVQTMSRLHGGKDEGTELPRRK